MLNVRLENRQNIPNTIRLNQMMHQKRPKPLQANWLSF